MHNDLYLRNMKKQSCLILKWNFYFILQAGDEPPFLSVGTDVSAKYRGAFCEAKVKKIVRTVKCKVRMQLTFITNKIL